MRVRIVLTFILLCGLVLTTGCLFSSAPRAEFSATPLFDYPPFVVEFDASASTSPNGAITTYGWSFGDGETGTGVKASHTFTEKGIYPVVLTVTDSTGAVGTRTRNVQALNRVPHAEFTFWPNMVGTNQEVTFDAGTSYDEDGYIVEWIWTFGDGTSAEGEVVGHTYLSAGGQGKKYYVTLTVIDDDNASKSVTKPVQVVGCDTCGG